MRRREFLAGVGAAGAIVAATSAKALTGPRRVLLAGAGIPSWVPNPSNPPDIAINWQTNQAWKKNGGLTTPAALGIATVRSTARTNLLPISPSGFAYTTFAANTTVQDSNGRQTFEGRTNFLLNSTAPATQTTASLPVGTYTLWQNGPGSSTPSAGTATITGATAATQGSPGGFTVTVAGTVTVTVSGSPLAFQLELNPGTVSAPTPLLITGASTLAGAGDVTSLTVSVGTAATFYTKAAPQVPTSYATQQYALELYTDSTHVMATLRNSGTGNALAFLSNGTTQYVQQGASWAQSASGKFAFAATTGVQNATFNEAAFTAGTGIFPPSLTTLYFGSNAGASFGNDITQIDAVWLNQALPLSQLQAM